MERKNQRGFLGGRKRPAQQQPLLSLLWQWSPRAVCALLALLIIWELASAIPILYARKIPDFGVRLEPTIGLAFINGKSTYGQIARIEAETPPACGLEVGQAFRIADAAVIDRWLVPQPGAQITLLAPAEGSSRACGTLRAIPRPFTDVELFDYFGRALLSIVALIFAGVVAQSPADRRHHRYHHYRYLSLAFATISLSLFLNFNFSSGPVASLSKWLALLAAPSLHCWMAMFALRYHPARNTWLYHHTRELTWLVWLPTLATTLCTAWYLSGHRMPGLNLMYAASVGTCLVVSFAALNISRLHSIGEFRQRISWLLAAFLIGLGPILILAGIAPLHASTAIVEKLVIAILVLGMVSWGVLTYAVLKHKVFDMEVAISRIAVWTCISVLLLLVTAGIKHVAQHYVEDLWEGPLWLAGISVFIYFVFHTLHHHIEEVVRRLFFKPWTTKAKDLQHFIHVSARYTTRHDLLENFHDALNHFNDDMGSAVYLQIEGREFAQAFNTVPGAPYKLGENDGLIVQLKAGGEPLPIAHQVEGGALPASEMGITEARGAMAFPMPFKDGISGLVVMAHKKHGQDYRKDEIELLERATRQVAFHLQSLWLDKAGKRG